MNACRFIVAPLALVTVLSSFVFGQLQITEILFDTNSSESRWEWVEVRNPGAAAFDLNGGYFFDDDGNDLPAPNIDSTLTPNTIIPAGGVAVLFNGGALDESRFRAAWGLAPSVPLIGVSTVPQLSNGGDAFGVWPNTLAYQADLGDGDMDGDMEIVQFINASASVDYNNFPDGGPGVSSYWNGIGNYQDGANWDTSDNDPTAVTSVMTVITAQINSSDDIGNPGIVTSTGTGPAALLITEIMSNPASSPESGWEWVEVFNNTGLAIDFSSTPFYFDDDDGSDFTMPNVASGVVEPGESAILFSDDITDTDFETAWGAGNYIAVDFGNGLSNAGDTIALWDNETAYTTDRAAGGTPAGAESYVPLAGPAWTLGTGDGAGSLTLVDRTDPRVDGNWAVSTDGDGSSFFASAVIAETTDHVGGDLGTPGSFGSTTVSGDFDGNGVYECADIDGLVAVIAAGTNDAAFDMTGDGTVDGTDLAAWLAEAGDVGGLTASGNPVLPGDANLDGTVDGSDFLVWNGSKFTSVAAWCSGDFNADGSVDGSDFLIWNAHKFQTADGVASVPEPTSALTLLIGLFGWIAVRRIR